VTGAREPTNVPSQALFLLNNDFVNAQARLLAQRILAAIPTPKLASGMTLRQERVNLAFRLVLDRPATAFEQNAAENFFSKMQSDIGTRPVLFWTDFCLSLFNTAEFRYLN
jgi:hypothetical protein